MRNPNSRGVFYLKGNGRLVIYLEEEISIIRTCIIGRFDIKRDLPRIPCRRAGDNAGGRIQTQPCRPWIGVHMFLRPGDRSGAGGLKLIRPRFIHHRIGDVDLGYHLWAHYNFGYCKFHIELGNKAAAANLHGRLMGSHR